MKKWCLALLMILLGSFGSIRVYGQANELAQLALDIEKLAQFKGILSDLKKGYEIVSKGYGTIKDLSQGNFSIHKAFLDGLMEVSPAVKNYRKVAEIADYQIQLVKEYKKAFERFKKSNLFQPKELNYLEGVYDNLFKSSLENLNELLNVVTANKLRMSDDERLKAIDQIHSDMEDKLNFLHSFNASTSVLAVQRANVLNEVSRSEIINGVKP